MYGQVYKWQSTSTKSKKPSYICTEQKRILSQTNLQQSTLV